MDWTAIHIQVRVKDLEAAAAIAQMAVPYGIYIEDYSDLEQQVEEIAHVDLIDQALLQKDRVHALVHLYIDATKNPLEAVSFLRERLEQEHVGYELKTEGVREEDWATSWQKYYHPIRVGKRLMVCPAWERCELAPGEVLLTLNPGMAFGTGTHETTRLCMELLEESVRPDCRMLDIGCGSGILAVTAALLGAEHAVGVDIDPMAVKVAKENAAINGVTEQTAFTHGDLASKVRGRYDVICANIVADAIIRLSESIRPLMQENGVWIVSGIIEPRAQEVIDALHKQHLVPIKTRTENGWVAIVCQID